MNVATPSNELLEKLGQVGWTLRSIDFKGGLYVAKADNEITGQDIERTGKTPEMALASVLQFANRAYAVRRYASLRTVASWDEDWLDKADEIGQAYAKMPVFDEKAVPAWKALAAESKIQADAIRKQITVEVVDDPEPYMSAQEMVEDIHKNRHFSVSRANSEHPIWSVEDNINFRIVHDVLGHAQSGGDFSWVGENKACGVHFPLVSPLAREALFTECIGQQAYYRAFHGFGPQKVGFLSQYLHPVQERQGEHVWVPHGGLPELQVADNMSAKGTMDQAPGMNAGIFNAPGDWVTPNQYQIPQYAPPSPVMGPSPVMQGYTVTTAEKGVSPDRPHDPNRFFVPGVQNPPFQDPSQDYLNIGNVVENASKVNTEWWNEDPATQDKAILNAFKVAILSPRKHLKWNAAHYQALMHADPSTKAVDLWNTLEDEREKHNQGLGYPEGSHLAYHKQLQYLAHELQTDDPSLSEAEALKKAKELIFEKTKEFEQGLGEDPANEGTSELKRYNMARQLVTEWLKQNYSPSRGWSPGQLSLSKTGETPRCPHCTSDELTRTPDGRFMCLRCYWEEGETLPPNDEVYLPEGWNKTADAESFQEAAQRLLEEWSTLSREEREKEMEDIKELQRRTRSPYDPINPGNSADLELAMEIMDQLQPKAPDAIPEDWNITSATLFDPDEWHESDPIDASGFASEDSKYGAFMGAHLDAIEQVGSHIDQIREAALKDLDEGGKGFVFRNAVMNMNLPGVNPKVASFVWLLLAPMSSELGIIDTHILRGLRRTERDNSPRDYYKLERMQRAAKDASGYSHVPLGLYHWGMWDAIRNPGMNSDHSALRVLDPLDWRSAQWDAANNARSGPWVGPIEFENHRPHMEQTALDFDKEMQGQPRGLVPLGIPPTSVTSTYRAPVL